MADQVVTTQDILNVVHEQQGVIASMSTFITAMHQRVMAGIGSQLSPQAQADLNEIFAEVRGNTNAITQAIAANTDPDTGAPAPTTGGSPPVADTGSASSAPASGASSTGAPANSINQGKFSLSATVTTLSTSKAIANVGDTVTLTAGVSGKDGNPKAITGSVTFHDEDGLSLGNASLDSTGVAALAVAAGTQLPPGDHEIVASYGGDASYASSDSAPLTQSVMPPVTSAPPTVNVVEPTGQSPQT